ncbi:DNA mismatch repair protein MutL, partial [candidate division WWE3 bacterium CG_4_9_14_3_um_filter_34_6]
VLQLHNLYLVTESESGIMVYDQHALHERILYEQLINANKAIKDEKNTQGLLTPVVINLSTQEASVVEEYLEDFKSAGFELEEFGPSTYKINQVPAPMVGKDINAITHELISDLEKDEKIKDTDSESNKMLTYLSCRMAYKAGDVLPQEEAVALIDQIPNLKIEYTCPHGRPLKIEFTLEELAKLFKRS